MTGPDILAQHDGVLHTRMGGAFVGSHAVFRGHDLHRDLREMDWLALYLFGITGRRFSAPQIKLLHAIWVYTSYPDARLWNNRIASLAGSTRSTPALGLSAALAVSEAVVYGGQAGIRCMGFLRSALTRMAVGEALPDIVSAERRIYGYGRPINAHDERIPWMMALARELGFADGTYVQLAFAVEKLLVARNPKLQMNYAALHAALLADMGLSTAEYQVFRLPTFLAGMPPCYVEAMERTEGASFPLPVAAIRYDGPAKRRWAAPLAQPELDRSTKHMQPGE